MRIEDHEESLKEHKETIFRWAVEVKGVEHAQRIIGLHASRAIMDMLSIYLLKKGKISPGKQLNHRWFKSTKAAEKIPEFENKKDIVGKTVELEIVCERLAYGSKRPVSEIKKALELFNELEQKIKGLDNEKE